MNQKQKTRVMLPLKVLAMYLYFTNFQFWCWSSTKASSTEINSANINSPKVPRKAFFVKIGRSYTIVVS